MHSWLRVVMKKSTSSQIKFCCPVNGKIILSDLLLTLFKSIILGVHQINLDNFKKFEKPKKHDYWIKKIDSVVLESLNSGLATQLEKS